MRAKILAAAILPFALFVIYGVFRIHQVVHHYELALKNNYEVKAKGVADAVKRTIDQMAVAVNVLSESEEISSSLQRADNNVLFDISSRFIGPVDTIVFADVNGTVISRAPDEYRFGDDISSKPYFKSTFKKGGYLGWLKIDGKDTLVMSKPIKKYDDIYVGLVCAGIRITKDFLRSFSDDPDVLIELVQGDIKMLSFDHREKIVYSQFFKEIINTTQKPLINLTVQFEEDTSFSELLNIRKSLYLISLPIALFLVIILVFLLNQQLKPYSMIVEHVLNYANKKTSAKDLKENLMDMNHASIGDSAKINSALIKMLDVIETNFKKIQQYNLELDQTNRKLEKSLKEVKTLSGLLPICSHCKKIRDDKGYWTQIESYIHEHSEAKFSHGICQECAKKYYPDFDSYED